MRGAAMAPVPALLGAVAAVGAAPATGGACDGYAVSGAGSAWADGCYRRAGDTYGAPLYQLNATQALYSFRGTWRIGTPGVKTQYVAGSPSATPPPVPAQWTVSGGASPPPAVGLNGPPGCAGDGDCNYAGTCVRGAGNGTSACRCDAPFHGEHCETFTLYSYKPGSGGLILPGGNTTWGGSVVEADDGTHHMYVALMTEHLSLGSWRSNSVCAHAVSTSGPAGPYVYSDIALGQRSVDGNVSAYWDGRTCHNPDVKRAPDGTYVIFHMGTTDYTPLPNKTAKQPNLEYNQRIGIAWSSSPYGPWTRPAEPIISPGPNGTWDSGIATNPAPHIYPNGTTIVVYKAIPRTRGGSGGGPMHEGVAIADSFKGPYRKLTPDVPLDIATNCEDAGLYSSSGGVLRMITHCGCSAQYMWSLDGVNWGRTTPEVEFCHNIAYTDGTTGSLATRQRPKWVVGKDGMATHLLTGVNRPGDGGMGHTWTMAARFTK